MFDLYLLCFSRVDVTQNDPDMFIMICLDSDSELKCFLTVICRDPDDQTVKSKVTDAVFQGTVTLDGSKTPCTEASLNTAGCD